MRLWKIGLSCLLGALVALGSMAGCGDDQKRGPSDKGDPKVEMPGGVNPPVERAKAAGTGVGTQESTVPAKNPLDRVKAPG